MFGWLKRNVENKLRNNAVNNIECDIKRFIQQLKGMDDDDIAFCIIIATTERHWLEKQFGWNLLDPEYTLRTDSNAYATICNVINKHHERGANVAVAANYVWAFSILSMTFPEIRIYGKEIWRELSRGFKFVESKYIEAQFTLPAELDLTIDGYNRIPVGLSMQS